MNPIDSILNSSLQDTELDATPSGDDADWGPTLFGTSYFFIAAP